MKEDFLSLKQRLLNGARGRLRQLRDRPDTPPTPKPAPKVESAAHHVMPNDLGVVGEHMVWTLIKGIQSGASILLVVTSEDGKSTTSLSLAGRKVA